jgi:hypothetical protein
MVGTNATGPDRRSSRTTLLISATFSQTRNVTALLSDRGQAF